jgi:hypothetical protein
MNSTHVSFIHWLEAVSLGIIPLTECMGPGPGRSQSATMNLAGRLGQGVSGRTAPSDGVDGKIAPVNNSGLRPHLNAFPNSNSGRKLLAMV